MIDITHDKWHMDSSPFFGTKRINCIRMSRLRVALAVCGGNGVVGGESLRLLVLKVLIVGVCNAGEDCERAASECA